MRSQMKIPGPCLRPSYPGFVLDSINHHHEAGRYLLEMDGLKTGVKSILGATRNHPWSFQSSNESNSLFYPTCSEETVLNKGAAGRTKIITPQHMRTADTKIPTHLGILAIGSTHHHKAMIRNALESSIL
jgi:hypothetical protein